MSLPAAFQSAVAAWLEANGPGGRRKESAALTATYQGGGSSRDIDFASLLVARLPATYAAVAKVLAEVSALRPEFVPASLLDAAITP